MSLQLGRSDDMDPLYELGSRIPRIQEPAALVALMERARQTGAPIDAARAAGVRDSSTDSYDLPDPDRLVADIPRTPAP